MERPTPQILGWDAVEEAARALFSVWMNKQEVDWAEEAWNILCQAGLPVYTCAYERWRAALYLMALADLYRDFCFLAWDEYRPLDIADTLAALKLSPLRIGQLIGLDDAEINDADECDALVHALKRLVAANRLPVLTTLIEGYRGVTGLFNALWRISEEMDRPYFQLGLFDEDGSQRSQWETAISDTGWGKLELYEWLETEKKR